MSRGRVIPVSDRVHAPSETPGRGYCGTNEARNVSGDWVRVTCPNCHAARRADQEARS